MIDPGVLTLVERKLYALPNAYALDGRVSTHPAHVRGFASMNCYVILERGRALLIDTGFSVHEQQLLTQLRSIVDPTTPLTIWLTRVGEYNSVCNVVPIAERFNVTKLIAAVPEPERWVDFRPRGRGDAAARRLDLFAGVETELVRPGAVVTLGPRHTRQLRAIPAPLRLLPTCWIYDVDTTTLFTSDAFTHTWRGDADGPWLIGDRGRDPTDQHAVWDYLTHSRFWWLRDAYTAPLREELANTFATHPVTTIAPAFGCILQGTRVVERHRMMLDSLLWSAPQPPRAHAEQTIAVTR
jgi:glyoxylase-like metal-dependent hydrolase (beta-lactamase superfamily II)